jgi:hypothetical protein
MSFIGGPAQKIDFMRDTAFGDDQLKALAAPDVYVAPEEIRRVDSAHQYRANNTTNPFSSAHFHYTQSPQQQPQQSSFQHNEKAYRQFLRDRHTVNQTTEPFRDRDRDRVPTQQHEQNRIYDLSTDIHSDVQKDLQQSNRHSKFMKRALINDRIRKFSTVNESVDFIRSDDNDSVCAQKEFNYWTKLNNAKQKEAEATLKSLMTFCAGSAENLINLFDIKGIKLNGLTKRVKRAFKKGRFNPALDQLQIFLNKYLDNPVTSSAVTLGNIIFKTNNTNRKKHIKAKLTGQEYISSSSDTDSSDDEEEEVAKVTSKKARSKSRTKSRSIEFHKKQDSSESEHEHEDTDTEKDDDVVDKHNDKLEKVLSSMMDKMDVISKRLDRLEKPVEKPVEKPKPQGEFRREIDHTKTYDIEVKGTYVPEEKNVAMNLLSKIPSVTDTIAEVHETQMEVEKAKADVEKVGPPPDFDYSKVWNNVDFTSSTTY